MISALLMALQGLKFITVLSDVAVTMSTTQSNVWGLPFTSAFEKLVNFSGFVGLHSQMNLKAMYNSK